MQEREKLQIFLQHNTLLKNPISFRPTAMNQNEQQYKEITSYYSLPVINIESVIPEILSNQIIFFKIEVVKDDCGSR